MADLSLEQKLWRTGWSHIIGVDEAGRGPWAGPVVAGAVLVTDKCQIVEGVNDSKKLSEKKREKLYREIISKATAFGVGIADANEIDRMGLAKALNNAMYIAINHIIEQIEETSPKVHLIIDGGNIRKVGDFECTRVDKGDMLHYSVAAASVLAKVTRDRMMVELSAKYCGYGFEKHKGYGTALHMDALGRLGVTEIHRKSFKPIMRFIGS